MTRENKSVASLLLLLFWLTLEIAAILAGGALLVTAETTEKIDVVLFIYILAVSQTRKTK